MRLQAKQAKRIQLNRPTLLDIFIDSEVNLEQESSNLSVVVIDDTGQIRQAWVEKAKLMTPHEAEIAALKMALRSVRQMKADRVRVFSNQETLVYQMRRYSQIKTFLPKRSGIEIVDLLKGFQEIHFYLLGRQSVNLADIRQSKVAL